MNDRSFINEWYAATLHAEINLDGVAMSVPKVKEYVELSHIMKTGMITFPGASDVEIYSQGPRIENGSLIDAIRCLGTSSTYIDAPYHVNEAGKKISDYPLDKLVNLPVVVIQKPSSRREFLPEDFFGADITGKAVLLYTANDTLFGLPDYAINAPFISDDAAQWLVKHKAALVGIDSLLVDNVDTPEKVPVHNALLGNEIIIAENMTNLRNLVGKRAYLTAVPPRAEMGSFPVRIFASIY